LVTLTHPDAATWVIELHNGEDSRLSPTLLSGALMPLLDVVELEWRNARHDAFKRDPKSQTAGAGALVIVGNRKQNKFFSNGLEMTSVGDVSFFPTIYNPVLTRILTFPIPTVAAVNGHAFAGGMMLSLACDYRVMTDGKERRAWMCMNEIDFGAPWPMAFVAVLCAKVGSPVVRRRIALEGHRFTPHEALEAGMVDALVPGNTEAILEKASELAAKWAPNARSGVWGLIKKGIYAEAIKDIAKDLRVVRADSDEIAARARL